MTILKAISNNNYAKPSAWGAQPLPPLLVLRRGLDPPPVPRPLQGGGSTARIRSLGH